MGTDGRALSTLGAVAPMRGLGAYPDGRCDLSPAHPQAHGLARQLVALLPDALEFKLGLPRPVKHRALLIAQFSPRPRHTSNSINQG